MGEHNRTRTFRIDPRGSFKPTRMKVNRAARVFSTKKKHLGNLHEPAIESDFREHHTIVVRKTSIERRLFHDFRSRDATPGFAQMVEPDRLTEPFDTT